MSRNAERTTEDAVMISNPGLPIAAPTSLKWPRLFSHWQLLSLVPGVIRRLEQHGRVLEIEVGGMSLLSSLARTYPASQFIGLTSHARAQSGHGITESSARNLHFRTVELVDLSRFRQVDLVLALGGLSDQSLIREVARSMSRGGFMVLREEERSGAVSIHETVTGTRFMQRLAGSWPAPLSLRHSLIARTFTEAFESVHMVRLPEDPGFVYYVATAV
jgi:hypothetical protein